MSLDNLAYLDVEVEYLDEVKIWQRDIKDLHSPQLCHDLSLELP